MNVKLSNVSVTYGVDNQISVLSNINLSVAKGEWINIIGPSGSGKTTLLNVISGLQQVSSGKIILDNVQLSQLPKGEKQTFRRNNISYIFQDFRLLEQFTVLENVAMPLLPYKNKKAIETESIKILKDLNMGTHIHKFPKDLSGGEKQRTAIARAMLMKPNILLCDEPTGNLDEENRNTILHLLAEIKFEGVTIILVTHDMEVAKWGDRKVLLRDGVLKEHMESV